MGELKGRVFREGTVLVNIQDVVLDIGNHMIVYSALYNGGVKKKIAVDGDDYNTIINKFVSFFNLHNDCVENIGDAIDLSLSGAVYEYEYEHG